MRWLLLVFLVGCAAKAKPATIRGADLYAHVGALRATGHAMVPSSARPLEVRREHFLVDRSRDQVFVVDQVIANCRGTGIDDDPDCTLALLRDQRFAVEETPPTRRAHRGEADDDGISPINRARLVTAALLVPLTIGAFKCDAFDGCGALLGIAAAADGLLLLVLFTGLR